MKWDDPIVADVRHTREELSAQFDFDLEAIFADIRARQVEVGDRLIRLEPRGPEQNDIQAASGRPVTNA